MSRQIVLAALVLGLIAATAQLLHRRAAERNATFHASTAGENGSQPKNEDAQMISRLRTRRRSEVFQTPAANADPTVGAMRVIAVRAAEEDSAKTISLEDIPAIRHLLPDSSPETRTLFERGLELMRDGDFHEARSAFQEIVRRYGGDKLEAPAYFLSGINFYLEGDLVLAADQFKNFQIFFGNDKEVKEFALAAQFDLAVTDVERMRTATTEQDRVAAAHAAVIALVTFLGNWPNSPEESAVVAYLLEVQRYIDGRN